MRFRLIPFVVFLLLLLVTAACGGSKAQPAVTADPSSPRLSDEAYLKAICTGTSAVSDAAIAATTKEAIAKVIQDFSASMKAINPPADLEDFQSQFVKYLDDAVSDPTSVLTEKPPLPPDGPRERLTRKESQVPECRDPMFFDPPAVSPASGSATAAPTK